VIGYYSKVIKTQSCN